MVDDASSGPEVVSFVTSGTLPSAGIGLEEGVGMYKGALRRAISLCDNEEVGEVCRRPKVYVGFGVKDMSVGWGEGRRCEDIVSASLKSSSRRRRSSCTAAAVL